MGHSPRRPTRADVSRALKADVTSSTPPAVEIERLAALAAAAPAGPSSAPWWRHGAAVTVLGAVLAGGVGASYAAGVIDAPWSPPDRPSEPVPVPSTPAPGQRSDSTDVPGVGPSSDAPTDGSTPPGDRGHKGDADRKGGRPEDAPASDNGAPPTVVPPETVPGEGTGRGQGHGPGGNPDHANQDQAPGRPDEPGSQGQGHGQGNGQGNGQGERPDKDRGDRPAPDNAAGSRPD